jgi:hypothetical protein
MLYQNCQFWSKKFNIKWHRGRRTKCYFLTPFVYILLFLTPIFLCVMHVFSSNLCAKENKLGINLRGVYYIKAISRTFMRDHIRIFGLFSTTERNVTRRQFYLFAIYLNILSAWVRIQRDMF